MPARPRKIKSVRTRKREDESIFIKGLLSPYNESLKKHFFKFPKGTLIQ
jgi:hypothetical protein